MAKARIISSATTDLVSDQRVDRICGTLQHQSYEVLALGRKRRNSLPLQRRPYRTKRLSLWFDSGPMFYAEFNIRLFFFLLFSSVDVLIANDLDTLPANYLAAKLRGKKLVYDSHEYFTEVPELIHRPLVRKCWLALEQLFFRTADGWITVSPSIAGAYEKKYKVRPTVIRNFPRKITAEPDGIPKQFLLEKNGRFLIIYQGSINVDRGLEEMIAAMEDLPNCQLLICGDGDIFSDLRKQWPLLSWSDRIVMTGRLPMSELSYYTRQADIGLSIEKLHGLSYTHALPNKVFDYIQVGLPVLISPLAEVEKLNEKFHFARVIDEVDSEHIVREIKIIMDDEEMLDNLKKGAVSASRELNWEKEEQKLIQLFEQVLSPA